MASESQIISDVALGLGVLSSFGPKVDIVGIYSNDAGSSSNSSATGITGLSSSIINSILGTDNTTASIGQQFVNARPMKATVRETSKVMEHPVETGVTLADHHIINPVEILMPVLIDSQFYAATYSQIRQAFINATPFAIKTRVGVYSDMILAEMPHDEEPEMYDVIVLELHFRQVIYAVPGNGTQVGGVVQNFQPIDALNSNTVAGGLQQATALGSTLLTSATSISTYAAAIGKGFL